MEFNCYDVLEVQGSRYVITEKIKYNEIIPKADKEQSYRGQPSMRLLREQIKYGLPLSTMIMNGALYLEHPIANVHRKALHYIKLV